MQRVLLAVAGVHNKAEKKLLILRSKCRFFLWHSSFKSFYTWTSLTSLDPFRWKQNKTAEKCTCTYMYVLSEKKSTLLSQCILQILMVEECYGESKKPIYRVVCQILQHPPSNV